MPASMKGKQVQVSLYLKPELYWLLRGTSKKSGFSMQYLLRRALEAVLNDTLKQVRRRGGNDDT
jgi:predicted DNA-binding protein